MVYSIHFTLQSAIIKMYQIDNGIQYTLHSTEWDSKMYQIDNGIQYTLHSTECNYKNVSDRQWYTVYTSLYRVGL
jgi:hypothetical protein